jgi:hypothetical protein
MSVTPSLAFPGSRTLAGWWRQLAPFRPDALWAGHLFLHQVEALVRLSRSCRPDPFSYFVLKALTLDATLEGLDGRLCVGRQMLHQVLSRLAEEGLVLSEVPRRWALTDLGREVLQKGEYRQTSHERRAFHFLDNRGLPGNDTHPLHYLNLRNHLGSLWQPGDGWEFNAETLHRCLTQPPEWKEQFGFPPEVDAFLDLTTHPSPSNHQPPAWQRVILDQPEHLLVVVVRTAGENGPGSLLGFTVRQDGWALQPAQPAFALSGDWRGVFPDLTEDPPLEVWRQAWRAWGQPRGFSREESDACSLRRQGERLVVTASRRFTERLRATRSDALKGEAWLLAGEGRLRAAGLLEIVEVKKSPV